MTTDNEKRSRCCNSRVYYVPTYYARGLRDNNGKKISMMSVCIKCGHECLTK
jgi:hypothetical protein